MSRLRRLVVTIVALGALSCFPYRGLAKREVPTSPIAFRDVRTEMVVPSVLVIPRYSSFSGVSTLAGEGPGSGSYRFWIGDLFVYEAGAPFAPSQPKSTGIVWGWFWAYTGKGVSLNGVLVVAPGYEPKWVWDLWSRSAADHFLLIPISPGEARSSLLNLARLLEKDELLGEDKDLWSLGQPHALENRVDDAGRALACGFITKAIQSLPTEPNDGAVVALANSRLCALAAPSAAQGR